MRRRAPPPVPCLELDDVSDPGVGTSGEHLRPGGFETLWPFALLHIDPLLDDRRELSPRDAIVLFDPVRPPVRAPLADLIGSEEERGRWSGELPCRAGQAFEVRRAHDRIVHERPAEMIVDRSSERPAAGEV